MKIIEFNDDFLQALHWEWNVLHYIEEASQLTGIQAWGSTGLFYRPFFNRIFGPSQDGFDKDVCVQTRLEAQQLLKFLSNRHPTLRWSVYSGAYENDVYNIPSNHWAIQTGRPLLFRLGAVRLRDGKISALISEDAYQSLLDGLIEINMFAFKHAKTLLQKERFRHSAVDRANKMISEYPRLKIGSGLHDFFSQEGRDSANYSTYSSSPINKECSYTKNFRPVNFRFTKCQEKAIKAPFIEATYPSPPLNKLPESLERVRDLLLRQETYFELTPIERAFLSNPQSIIPPLGSHSWSSYCFRHEVDSAFKEWFISQIRSRNPLGGQDSYLKSLFNGTNLTDYGHINMQSLHYGQWAWKRYIREKITTLKTDSFEKLDIEIRCAIRMAILFFDLDVIVSPDNQYPHELAIAIWESSSPTWISTREHKIVQLILEALYNCFGAFHALAVKSNSSAACKLQRFHQKGDILAALKKNWDQLVDNGIPHNIVNGLLSECCRSHMYATVDLQYLSFSIDELFDFHLPTNQE